MLIIITFRYSTVKFNKFSEALPPINFDSGKTKKHDKIAIKTPMTIAKRIPIDDMISASFSSFSPIFFDIMFPLPYPNQNPIAWIKLIKLNTIPIAAVMDLLFKIPTKNVSVRL